MKHVLLTLSVVLCVLTRPARAELPLDPQVLDKDQVTEQDKVYGQTQGLLKLQTLTGTLTQDEVHSFKDYIGKVAFPKPSDFGAFKYQVFQLAAQHVAAMGMVYEAANSSNSDSATRQEILDRMIAWSGKLLSKRNDIAQAAPRGIGQRMIWTGKRDLVWPNKSPNGAMTRNAGPENGEIAGQIAYCARLIIQNSAIWNREVPDHDPYGHGATYLARAYRFLDEAQRTADAFLIPNFVAKDLLLILPISPEYMKASAPERDQRTLVKMRGAPLPWNQQFMITNALQRVAETHSLLLSLKRGGDANTVAKYDAIVGAAIDSFFRNSEVLHAANGMPYLVWKYMIRPDRDPNEDIGHASADIGGLYRAYYSGRYAKHVSPAQMVLIANGQTNVAYHQESNGDWKWSFLIDGTNGGSGNVSNNTPLAGATFYSFLFQPNRKAVFEENSKKFNAYLARIGFFEHLVWLKSIRTAKVSELFN